jgi:hypothetical protein
MLKKNRLEVVSVVQGMLAVLLSSSSPRNPNGPKFALDVAAVLSNTEQRIFAGTIATDLALCFSEATAAGASYAGMDAVRTYLIGLAPKSLEASAAVQIGVQLTLSQMSLILSATTYVSRTDIENDLQKIGAAFEAAEEYAADQMDSANYRALITLHAAIVNDLTTRQRPLPRMINYSVGSIMPSLALANYLFGDASRADQLRDENHAIDPRFMAQTGVALSN